MFYEWVSDGAAFGIKAFFAAVVFLICVAAVVGLLALLTMVMGENKDEMRH